MRFSLESWTTSLFCITPSLISLNVPVEILPLRRSWAKCSLLLEIRSSYDNGSGLKTRLRLLESVAHWLGLPALFLWNNTLAYIFLVVELGEIWVWLSSWLTECSPMICTALCYELKTLWRCRETGGELCGRGTWENARFPAREKHGCENKYAIVLVCFESNYSLFSTHENLCASCERNLGSTQLQLVITDTSSRL